MLSNYEKHMTAKVAPPIPAHLPQQDPISIPLSSRPCHVLENEVSSAVFAVLSDPPRVVRALGLHFKCRKAGLKFGHHS